MLARIPIWFGCAVVSQRLTVAHGSGARWTAVKRLIVSRRASARHICITQPLSRLLVAGFARAGVFCDRSARSP
jgi:hypothetical protein